MSRPNRWRCTQLHARCTRSSPRELPAARSIEPSVCLASWMNAITMSTNGTTMISATAAVLIEAAAGLAEAALRAACAASGKTRRRWPPTPAASGTARTADRAGSRGGGCIHRTAAWCFAAARVDPASATNLTPTPRRLSSAQCDKASLPRRAGYSERRRVECRDATSARGRCAAVLLAVSAGAGAGQQEGRISSTHALRSGLTDVPGIKVGQSRAPNG